MKKLAQESVVRSMTGLRAEIKEVRDDRQHFVDSLTLAMNEVTHLRNTYEVFDEWTKERRGASRR